MNTYLQIMNVQRQIMQSLLGITVCAVVISGCAGGTTLAHNSNGSVYLEEVSSWSYEASHPSVIDQITITKIVKGLHRNNDMNGSSGMPAGGSKPMRIFSDEDAEFLSPLLAQGLSKAKPDQLVGFRVSSSAGSGSEPTTGSIYVQNGSIYLTVQRGTESIGFLPESAIHIEPAPTHIAGSAPGAMTMVIDYHALAGTPMPAAMPVAKIAPITTPSVLPITAAPIKAQPVSANAGQMLGQDELLAQKLFELRTAKEMLVKKDSEIIMLRKEAEWMKRQLRDRDEEMKALRSTKVSAKPTPKKKTAHATPTR